MTDPANLALLRRLEASVTGAPRTHADVIDVGPFRAWIDSTTRLVWLSYAVPIGNVDDEAVVADAIADSRQRFNERDRTLSFEFTLEIWPSLPSALERAGLRLFERLPLMLCTAATFRSFQASGVTTELLHADDADAKLRAFLTVQAEGFGESLTDSLDEGVARLRARLTDGQLAALGRLNGEAAGSAAMTGMGGVGELVGVATAPRLRRRGVAATLSAFLAGEHFARGNEVAWLSAADAAAQSVYARIGFQVLGTSVKYVDGEAADG